MTREEARQQAAIDYCNNLIREATFGQFVAHIAGSKWADETMINKVCDWLRVELDKEEELHYIHVHGFDKERREIFLEELKKAMKGD